MMFLSHLKRLAGLIGALAGLCFVLTLAGSSAYAQGRGSAHLTIKRTSADYMYRLAPATVSVSGRDVATVSNGATVTVAIPAGLHTVRVAGFLHPGSSSVVINARPGGRYAVEISPRTESLAPGVLLGLTGTMIDAAVNKNAGAFNIRLTRR